MIAELVVYATPFSTSERIKILEDIGFNIWYDSVNSDKQYFLKQYKDTPHQVFYFEPFMKGVVQDIDFEILGIPDFIIYYQQDYTPDEDWDIVWKKIAAYIQLMLAGGEVNKEMVISAQKYLGTKITPVKLVPPPEQDDCTENFIKRDAHAGYFVDIRRFDCGTSVWSVKKPLVKDPFTVIIPDCKNNGPLKFFADLCGCPDWGDNDDLQFLELLKDELKFPFDIEKFTANFTEQTDIAPVLRQTIDVIIKEQQLK